VDLAALLRARGLDEVVIKPQISLSAFATSRVSRATAAAAQGQLDALTRERAVMVQPFLSEVLAQGELSFVFLGGVHSHTVRKRPRRGDFRVQQEHGGSRERVYAGPELVAAAARIIAAAEQPLLYARVDAIETPEGLVLMELEAIDPELFFGLVPGAAERFAEQIAAAIGA
jgi:glutathione synthase/RimK-type ligase-like ATP-grasp enzyme